MQKVTLRFLAGSHAFATECDVVRVLRHRYVIGYYVLGICLVASYHGIVYSDGKASLELPMSLATLISFMVVAVAYLRVWVWLSGRAEVVRVWMSPGLLLAAAAAHGVSDVLHNVVQSNSRLPLPVWASIGVSYLLAEGLVWVASRSLLPRAQQSVQAGRDALAVLSLGDSGPFVNFGKIRIACADIIRVEANGNHVHIVTRQKSHIVPGPFAAMLGEFPKGMGYRVHRSHWVAVAHVTQVVQADRGLRLLTAEGASVPVSKRPAPEVAQWLDGLLHDRAAGVTRDVPPQRADDAPSFTV